MTFDEYWEKNQEVASKFVINNLPKSIISIIKAYMQSAWNTAQKVQFKIDFESAQPKWTYCKDAMPDKTGNYLWLDNDRHVHIDHYWADMPLMPYVIAWMPLPDVPND